MLSIRLWTLWTLLLQSTKDYKLSHTRENKGKDKVASTAKDKDKDRVSPTCKDIQGYEVNFCMAVLSCLWRRHLHNLTRPVLGDDDDNCDDDDDDNDDGDDDDGDDNVNISTILQGRFWGDSWARGCGSGVSGTWLDLVLIGMSYPLLGLDDQVDQGDPGKKSD